MPLKCPDGWEMVSQPSTPSNYKLDLPDYSPSLSSVTYTKRKRHGDYEWVAANGVLPVQGNCGEQFTFTGGFTIESSSSHSINLGTLFNLPGTGEAVEISGGYAYTWGSAQGAGSGIEITKGPDKCWEYMAVPVVLKFTICVSWQRSGAPWWEWTVWALNKGPGIPPGAITIGVNCEDPLYIRGGLMICRRWCCEGTPPTGTGGGHH